MHKQQLENELKKCHEKGQKTAVCFCSHVPLEVLDAAGFCGWRLPAVEEFSDQYPGILPKNVCPTVRSCCALLEDPVLDHADLIITESSCDGKKKMYELIPRQDQLYYYQVIQGAEREYTKPLIQSEIRCLIQMLKDRFGADVTEESLRQACEMRNAERESVTQLLEIQKTCPPPATGMCIYDELEKNRAIADCRERILANQKSREALLNAPDSIPNHAPRILITGCPLGGVYKKVIRAIEENGGVVVCFENCEATKSHLRHVDPAAADIIDALAECYLHTSCAIMESNSLRFRQLEELAQEYQADGVIDVALSTCHAYSCEKFKVQRFLRERDIPYFYLETNDASQDVGQLTTRVAAFLEML